MSNISRFPVKDLSKRYGIGRTALYERFKAANVRPEKDGTRSYISSEELEELDRLDSYLKTGGSFEDFKPNLSSAIALTETEISLSGQPELSDLVALVEAIAKHMQPTNPLQEFRELEEAADKGWLLPTSKVKQLIGVSPRNQSFTWGSFTFTKQGKISRQSAWRVNRVSTSVVPKPQ